MARARNCPISSAIIAPRRSDWCATMCRQRATIIRSTATPCSMRTAIMRRWRRPVLPWQPPTPSSMARSPTPFAPSARLATMRGPANRWVCLFNNVAIAARHALDVRGLERVAIVDFDVHHGNGTAESVAHDPRILMVSFFQHPYYPYSDVESYTDTRVNVPVPARSKGDVVRQLVQDHWLPALHRQQPQMIFISAGFDAHREDDVGGMGLVEADYTWLTQQMMAVANQYGKGRIVSCLEGGYNLSSLGRSVAAHVKALAEL